MRILLHHLLLIFIYAVMRLNALAEKIKKYTGKLRFKNADIPKTEIYVPKNEVKKRY